MRGSKNPFASPHAIGQSRKKTPSVQELSEQIVQLFKDPDSAVTEIPMANDRQIVATINSIISKFKAADDWDLKLDLIIQTMGIVKGGAVNFISFIQHVEKFEPLLSDCILSLRGALVKYSCLLISQLSQKLCESFAAPVLGLIPTLFRPTQNAAQMIADSCRFAVLNVARYCQSKKVLQAILEFHTSKSGVHRTLVAHCVFLIVSNWERDHILSSFRLIEKVLISLLSDPSPDARQFARDTVRKLQEIEPQKCQRIIDQLDKRTRVSIDGPASAAVTIKISKRAASVGNEKRHSPVRQSAGTPKAQRPALIQPEKPTFQKGQERKYLSYLKQLVLQGECDEIVQNADEITESIMVAFSDVHQEVIVLAMTILDGVISVIPDAFLVHLSDILPVLFEQSLKESAGSKMLAEKLISAVRELYPYDELLDSALNCPGSWPAFLFINKVLRSKGIKIRGNVMENTVKLCVSVASDDDRSDEEIRQIAELLLFLKGKHKRKFARVVEALDKRSTRCLRGMGVIDRKNNAESDSYSYSDSDSEDTRFKTPPKQTIKVVTTQSVQNPVEEEEEEEEEQTEVTPFRSPVITTKISCQLVTRHLLDIPPEPQLIWDLENAPSTIVTIKPTRQSRKPSPLRPQAAVHDIVDIVMPSPKSRRKKSHSMRRKRRMSMSMSSEIDTVSVSPSELMKRQRLSPQLLAQIQMENLSPNEDTTEYTEDEKTFTTPKHQSCDRAISQLEDQMTFRSTSSDAREKSPKTRRALKATSRTPDAKGSTFSSTDDGSRSSASNASEDSPVREAKSRPRRSSRKQKKGSGRSKHKHESPGKDESEKESSPSPEKTMRRKPTPTRQKKEQESPSPQNSTKQQNSPRDEFVSSRDGKVSDNLSQTVTPVREKEVLADQNEGGNEMRREKGSTDVIQTPNRKESSQERQRTGELQVEEQPMPSESKNERVQRDVDLTGEEKPKVKEGVVEQARTTTNNAGDQLDVEREKKEANSKAQSSGSRSTKQNEKEKEETSSDESSEENKPVGTEASEVRSENQGDKGSEKKETMRNVEATSVEAESKENKQTDEIGANRAQSNTEKEDVSTQVDKRKEESQENEPSKDKDEKRGKSKDKKLDKEDDKQSEEVKDKNVPEKKKEEDKVREDKSVQVEENDVPETKDKSSKSKHKSEKESKEKSAKARDKDEKETRDKSPKRKERDEKESKHKSEKESKDRSSKSKDKGEKESRERSSKSKDKGEKESKDRSSKSKDKGEKETRERSPKSKDKGEKDSRERSPKSKDKGEKETRERSPKSKDKGEKESRERSKSSDKGEKEAGEKTSNSPERDEKKTREKSPKSKESQEKESRRKSSRSKDKDSSQSREATDKSEERRKDKLDEVEDKKKEKTRDKSETKDEKKTEKEKKGHDKHDKHHDKKERAKRDKDRDQQKDKKREKETPEKSKDKKESDKKADKSKTEKETKKEDKDRAKKEEKKSDSKKTDRELRETGQDGRDRTTKDEKKGKSDKQQEQRDDAKETSRSKKGDKKEASTDNKPDEKEKSPKSKDDKTKDDVSCKGSPKDQASKSEAKKDEDKTKSKTDKGEKEDQTRTNETSIAPVQDTNEATKEEPVKQESPRQESAMSPVSSSKGPRKPISLKLDDPNLEVKKPKAKGKGNKSPRRQSKTPGAKKRAAKPKCRSPSPLKSGRMQSESPHGLLRGSLAQSKYNMDSDQLLLQKVRAKLEECQDPEMQQLVRILLTVDDKSCTLVQIGDLIREKQGKCIRIVLPHLIRLTRSRYANQVEKVLRIVSNYVDSPQLMDMVIDLLDEPDSGLFLEFLTRVIACATKLELAPRVRKIMNTITPLLQHSAAEVRKHAVLCIVEMRFVMGPGFEAEIRRLKSVPRKLVIHYYQKRVSEQ